MTTVQEHGTSPTPDINGRGRTHASPRSGPDGVEASTDLRIEDSRFSAQAPHVAVLTAGRDRPYALGLASALIAQGLYLDFISGNDVDGPKVQGSPQVNNLKLRGDQNADAGLPRKIIRVLAYYFRLIGYALTSRPKIFHILWNNKFELFDRTVLMLFYRVLGKKIVFTAHNVNARARDGGDSWLNRVTLKFQYRCCDHIFVHTEKMKDQLVAEFGVTENRVTVIRFGVNSTVPETALTDFGARERLGLSAQHKVVLFFGMIAPYKGLEHLVEAIAIVLRRDPSFRLVVAGQPKNCPEYWEGIQRRVARLDLQDYLIQRIEFLPDSDIEVYFKAADLLVLPYTYIFQSGVLLLGYNFGLPVIATNVGSLSEDIVEGVTGFVCRPEDPADLAKRIEDYFSHDLYRQLARSREHIRSFAVDRYSWTKTGEATRAVYARLLT